MLRPSLLATTLGLLIAITNGCSSEDSTGDAASGGTGGPSQAGTGGGIGDGAPCAQGQTLCGEECAELSSDPEHCGSCEHSCQSGQVCSQGSCASECAAGETNCSGACVDLQQSTAHCGSCANECTAGSLCAGGSCQPLADPVQVSCDPDAVKEATNFVMDVKLDAEKFDKAIQLRHEGWVQNADSMVLVSVQPGGLSGHHPVLTSFDTQGQLEWSKKVIPAGTGDGLDRTFTIRGLAPIPGGGFILAATGAAGNYNNDARLVRIERDGRIAWSLELGNPDFSKNSGGPILIRNGEIIATMSDVEVRRYGGRDDARSLVVYRISLDGELLSGTAYKVQNNVEVPPFYIASLRAEADGSLVVTGTHTMNAGTKNEQSGSFIVKLSDTGSVLSSKLYTTEDELATLGDHLPTADGGTVLLGATTLASPAPTSPNPHHYVAVKVDSTGGVAWANRYKAPKFLGRATSAGSDPKVRAGTFPTGLLELPTEDIIVTGQVFSDESAWATTLGYSFSLSSAGEPKWGQLMPTEKAATLGPPGLVDGQLWMASATRDDVPLGQERLLLMRTGCDGPDFCFLQGGDLGSPEPLRFTAVEGPAFGTEDWPHLYKRPTPPEPTELSVESTGAACP